MKKRIISLILVVVLTTLALTGCAFNYSRANLSKFATLNGDFDTARWNLSIKDGDFGTDPAKRWEKVESTIIAKLLAAALADADSKHYAGAPDLLDYFGYCYYAVYTDKDEVSHILLTSKMDETAVSTDKKTQVVQLGLSGLKDLDKAISDAVLEAIENGELDFYSTSANTAVKGAVLSVNYTKTEVIESNGNGEGEGATSPKSETLTHQVITVGGDEGSFAAWLLGQKIGVDIDGSVTVTEIEKKTTTVKNEETGEDEQVEVDIEKKYTYSNVKINSEIKAPSTGKTPVVNANDIIYITYTKKVTLDPDTINAILGDGTFNNVTVVLDGYKGAGNNTHTETHVYEKVQLGDKNDETFFGKLVGANTGSVSDIEMKESITGKIIYTDADGNEQEVPFNKSEYTVTYDDINIHWTVKEEGTAIVVDSYKPTSLETTDIHGEKVKVTFTENGNETLVYYVFPVFYIDVDNMKLKYDPDEDKMSITGIDAETLLLNFYKDITATEYEEHDETADHNHEDHKVYAFDTLKLDKFTNTTVNKNIKALVEELVKLQEDYTSKQTDLTKKETSLNTAIKNWVNASESTKGDKADLLAIARTEYGKALDAFNEAEKKLNEKIDEIAACKEKTGENEYSEKTVADALANDYVNYNYDSLEATYQNTIRGNVITALADLMVNSITYNKLPARAVRQARKAILNVYKNAFYTGTTGSGANAISNYQAYANFDAYLVATIGSELKTTVTIEEAEAYIDQLAEKTVSELIMIYIIAEQYGLELTKQEKKDYKKIYKNMEAIVEVYGSYGVYNKYIYGESLDPTTQTLQDYLNGKQFDKIMDFFLAEDENYDGPSVKYTNINFSVPQTA